MKNWLKIVFVLDARPCISSWTSVTVFTTARWHSKTSARKPVCSKLIITSIIFHALPGFFFFFVFTVYTNHQTKRTNPGTDEATKERTNEPTRTNETRNKRTYWTNERPTIRTDLRKNERADGWTHAEWSKAAWGGGTFLNCILAALYSAFCLELNALSSLSCTSRICLSSLRSSAALCFSFWSISVLCRVRSLSSSFSNWCT